MLNTTAHKAFYESCLRHDLTYEYSDDIRAWRRGQGTYNECLSLANAIPRADAVTIWNEIVDRKLTHSSRVEFYWDDRRAIAAKAAKDMAQDALDAEMAEEFK